MRKPIDRITVAAASIADGELEARVPVEGGTQLELLGATVNRMASELNARIAQVHQDRRTRDLVLAAMDEGVLLIGSGGEVRYANPAALRLVGRRDAGHRGA